nr:F-box-like domain-containing protein [Cedratvirus lena]
MSSFELLPNEVLEHIFSYVIQSQFPLRQTCKFFRNNIEPIKPYQFVKQCYLVGDVALIQHYKLPCSMENFNIVLEKGHEEVFKIRKNIDRHSTSMTPCAVRGRNRFIINYILNKGYETRASLVYEACRQNSPELVKELYTSDVDLHWCATHATAAESLDVLQWIVEKDQGYYNIIVQGAVYHHSVAVLRWLPRKVLVGTFSKRDLFLQACDAKSADMFKFLLGINYFPKQKPSLSISLAESENVEMMRMLVLERGWILNEEMFDAALSDGNSEMLSCLLHLGCPHADPETLYSIANEEGVYWLLSNFSPTENILRDLCCTGGQEAIIIHLIKNNLLPESFEDDPDITLAALEEGFIDAAHAYLEADYTFYDDASLQVSNSTSLDWLIENRVGLCPELYYRLAKEAELSLLKKLEHLVDFPSDLLDYVFGLISGQSSHGRIITKLKKIAEWIKNGDV